MQTDALVIGGGPAGLMAADTLSEAGHSVLVADHMPSLGRKLLMAGKSGLNLTMDVPPERLIAAYPEAAALGPILSEFDAAAVRGWATALDQEVFTGSSGRIFPRAMKASPLLRAWLGRLNGWAVTVRTRWRWTGWDGAAALFETPDGPQSVRAAVTVLAMGGASWRRLGSDGGWADVLAAGGHGVAPFAPANAGLAVDWSAHMTRHFGAPIKGCLLVAGGARSRGEFVISGRGLEGGGIYAVSRAVRLGAPLSLDLLPDRPPDWITERLAARGKRSLSEHLRKALRLDPAKIALVNEFARPLPEDLAPVLKALPIRHDGPRPLDEAISTAGGLRFEALDDDLMLRDRPGTFAAGEMLDWEAPTGGYLLTACLATGRHAGRAAARFIAENR